MAYVPVADATYQAWLAAGGVATNILNAAELLEVLQNQWSPLVSAAGVAIVSTGTPALNGTYAIDPATLANIVGLSTGIAAGKPLPGGGSTFNYRDIVGSPHAFTAANFLNFAAAIESYVYGADQAIETLVNGGTAMPPSQPVTIP